MEREIKPDHPPSKTSTTDGPGPSVAARKRPGGDERRRIRETARRTSLHGEATRLLMESLDYEVTLSSVASLALPDLGAWSIVDLIETGGVMRRVAIVHSDPEIQAEARQLRESWPPETEDPIGAPVVMRTRQRQVVEDVTDDMLVAVARDAENLARLRRLGVRSFVVVPLIAGGEVLGAITFVRAARVAFTAEDLTLAEDLAALSAMAIERAQLYRQAATRAAEAERRQRDMERIMEIQARLVRGFSHDVKNPLGAAHGYTQLLEDGLLDSLTPRQAVSIERISASIRTALSLIDELVEYAKTKMGRVEVHRGPTNVGDLTSEIVEEYRAQIEAAGLGLDVEIPSGLPVIQSDRLRIRQILGNLLSNAVRYTSQGRVTVTLEVTDGHLFGGSGAWLAVHVSDTGIGIPEDDHDLVFQEFARLDPKTTKGSGLGLAISKWVADSLDARITLESAPGEGSTFTLWLPTTPQPSSDLALS